METVLIAVGAVILTQAADRLMRREERKAESRTLLELLECVAELSAKGGCPSWIRYLEETRGKEETLYFISRLYGLLGRSGGKGEAAVRVRAALKEYLDLSRKTSREAGK